MGLFDELRKKRLAGAECGPFVAREILTRAAGDPLKFLCMTSAEPSLGAVSLLPGDSPAEKAAYFATWVEVGFEVGLTAWDMIQATHDSAGLRGCTPTRNGAKITDPAEAVEAIWPNGGDENSGTFYLLKKALAGDPGCANAKIAVYQKRAGA